MKTGYWFVLPWEPKHAGGVNQVVLNLNNHLQQRGMNSSIFVGSWENINFHEVNENGVSMRYGRLRDPWTASIKSNLMYWLTCPTTLIRLAKTLHEENVMCVNPHYPTTSILTFVILRKLGGFQGRLLLSLHGLDFTGIEASKGIQRLIWRIILRNSDAIVACSQSLANRISNKFPDLLPLLKVVHNGFDPLAFEAERDQTALLPAELQGAEFILNIGTYEHKKGQDVLLQAFYLISEKFPHLKLVLIGRNGPVLDSLQKTVADFGLQERIIFIKDLPHAKIAPFFESAKLFVLPSRAESLPVVILEAGAFRLPVIASRVDGLPEILNSPDLGIMVEPDDVSALAAALDRALSDPEWASSLSRRLQAHIKSNFTWNKAADNYLTLLEPNPL